ncbi:thioredoxin family protein, putative [Ichthyophthirius multifiliis]|uniref:Thioredoxin family protein, putative n=1 Tax=Ichthyophthirius multifiliis TaxID=5932 RepID=G0R4T8_ICHMU|nr:thioredoxin family protein, putative [Ichthyophthirius multifiliis]EGR27526.1 thioredoxin family protein, putative [Ichthyophthirius multifiliis]|eukprot:XP_004024978.1 thioredoxin family protein, putative [Ichthyophthirius multifiliis]
MQTQDIRFGHIFDKKIRLQECSKTEKKQVDEDQENLLIIMYKKQDGEFNKIFFEDQQFKAHQLQQFIQKNELPLIMGFNEKAVEVIYKRNKDAVILVCWINCEKEEEVLKQLAKRKDKEFNIQFMISKIDDGFDYFERLIDFVGLQQQEQHQIVYAHPIGKGEELIRYILSQQIINQEIIIEFIEGVQTGKIVPFYKSQPIPDEDANDIIKVIVGQNFKQKIIDNQNDFLVLFYASWCGKSKEFEPKYQQLAKLLKPNKNLTLTKIEGSENDIPEIYYKGFPTLFVFQSLNKQQPFIYEGKMEVDEILNWLKEKINYQLILQKEEF